MYLIPLTNDPVQIQNFTHEDYNFTLTAYWNSVGGFWAIDLFDNRNQEYLTQYETLAVGAMTCEHLDMSFGFVMLDTANVGEPPTSIDDMGTRLNLYIIEKVDYYEAIRSVDTIDYWQ